MGVITGKTIATGKADVMAVDKVVIVSHREDGRLANPALDIRHAFHILLEMTVRSGDAQSEQTSRKTLISYKHRGQVHRALLLTCFSHDAKAALSD
jgi:hypothetical protein